jgi:hypothetical protein
MNEYVNILESQNVLEVNEPVLIVRPDDCPIGPKQVALNVLLIVIIDVLDENINTLYKTYCLSLKCLSAHVQSNFFLLKIKQGG